MYEHVDDNSWHKLDFQTQPLVETFTHLSFFCNRMWRIISIKSVESKLYKGSPKQLLYYFVNIREGLNIYWVIILPRLRHPRVFVHFHSFSCVATLPSSITSGTQPPNTYILLPITVEECRLLGSGADPFRVGFVQFMVSTTPKRKLLNYAIHQRIPCRP